MATESVEELAAGKRLAEGTVHRLAAELNIPVTGFTWRDDYPGPYLATLVFNVMESNQRGSVELRVRTLEDARNPNNKAARATMEEEIRKGLQELSIRLSQ
jgi:hypothetical protein